MSEETSVAAVSRRLSVYAVATKDERVYTEPLLDDGTGPSHSCWPAAPVVAETPAQAKTLFLRDYGRRLDSGLFPDDYPNLRVRVLLRGTDLPAGVRHDDNALWDLWPQGWLTQDAAPAAATQKGSPEDGS